MRIRHLRVHIKELASEAAHIRHEERQCSGMEKWRLQNHRKTAVRDAARAYQLAYACLRGVPYRVVEPYTKPERRAQKNAALAKAGQIVVRFGGEKALFDAWLKEAKAPAAKESPSVVEGRV